MPGLVREAAHGAGGPNRGYVRALGLGHPPVSFNEDRPEQPIERERQIRPTSIVNLLPRIKGAPTHAPR